jgi:hypothetical protein
MITLDEGAQQNAVPQNPKPESADFVAVAFFVCHPEGDLLLSLPLFVILSGAESLYFARTATKLNPYPQCVIPPQAKAIPSASDIRGNFRIAGNTSSALSTTGVNDTRWVWISPSIVKRRIDPG